MGGDSHRGRTRARKGRRAIKVAIFFFSGRRKRNYFLQRCDTFFFLFFQSIKVILGNARQDFYTLETSGLTCLFSVVAAAALILLFVTFCPRPPRAHFLPAGPKIEACVLFVLPRSGASRCSSSSAVVDSGGFCATPLLDIFLFSLSLSLFFSIPRNESSFGAR